MLLRSNISMSSYLLCFLELCIQFSRYMGLEQLSFRQVGLSGLEPPTSRLSGVRSNRLSYKPGCILFRNTSECRLTCDLAPLALRSISVILICSLSSPGFRAQAPGSLRRKSAHSDGDEEIRTLDPLLARQVLSQLSYVPVKGLLAASCSPTPSPA